MLVNYLEEDRMALEKEEEQHWQSPAGLEII